jgi:outer membrane protein
MNHRLGLTVALLASSTGVAANDLLGVFQDAVRNDPQIRQADANRLAAREARPQAWSNLLPQVQGTASQGRTHSAGLQDGLFTKKDQLVALPESITADTTQKQWAITLRQNVFSWANWMTLKVADSQVAQAEASYEAAEQNLIFRLSQAYFNVLSAIDDLDAQQASLEAISRQLDEANRRVEVGLSASTDVEEAKAARDTASAAVIAAKRTLATSEDQLQEITGKKYDVLAKPGNDMPLNMPDPSDENRWVEISMDQNLSLVASRLAADIARNNVRVAFGSHLPTLDLQATREYSNSTANQIVSVPGEGPALTFPNFGSRINDRQISLQITVPIYSGGNTQSKVRQAQYTWVAAKEAVVQTSRATERQARDAYLGVISGIARVRALRQALDSSQTALKATEAGYEVGTRTAVDVLNSRRSLVQAQTDYSGSRYDFIVSLVQLRLAAGNLDREQLVEINNWLTSSAPTSPSSPTTAQSLTPPVASIEVRQSPSAPYAAVFGFDPHAVLVTMLPRLSANHLW